MRKIILIGKLNGDVQNINKILMDKYNIQICSDNMEMITGMMKIVKPELIIVCTAGLEEDGSEILHFMEENYPFIPVIGIEKRSGVNIEFYQKNQFTRMVSPVSGEEIRAKCREILKESGEDYNMAGYSSVRKKGGRKRVLIVDDSALAVRSIKAILDDTYEVIISTSGKQAIGAMKIHHPDLVLLDYEMPEFDGKMTLEYIRKDSEIRDIPVIFLTSVADKTHIAAVLELNPAGYFLKPPERVKLLEAIDKILK